MAGKSSYILTSRYAGALIDLAQETGKLDAVAKDLDSLSAMITNSPELSYLVTSAGMSQKSQIAGLTGIAEKAGFSPLTKNFLNVLIQNRRLSALPGIIASFQEETARRRGEVTVQVETAQDLTPAQLKSLQDALAKGMGRDVSIRAKVEPSILGGMIVTVGSRMIDDSVRRKLERLKAAMGRQANQNPSTKSHSA